MTTTKEMVYRPDVDIRMPYQYKPRDYQVPFWQALQNGYKRHVLIWHRRAGKDITILNATAQAMADTYSQLSYGGVGTYYYFFPTFAQGKKVIWDGITGKDKKTGKPGKRFIDFIPKELRANTWNDEMKIRLKNGSLFQIVGTDNFDAIMGTNPIWCVFSEYALQNPAAWDYIRPILRENKGIAIFPYTPRGHNHGYDLYFNVGKIYEDTWFSELLTVDDTGILTSEDIEEERKDGMSEDLIQQEFYCSFNMGVEGLYYAKYIDKVRQEERILDLPIDSTRPVHTAWDIGVKDATAIIFYQVFPGRYHIVDYYENVGEGVQHYAKVLKNKGYVYGNHYGPHDLKGPSWSFEGLPTIEVARNFNIHFNIVKKFSIQDGIEAGRNLFSRCYFDKQKALPLINHLENYSKVWSPSLNIYTSKPRHDKHSHGADAWRYFALAEKTQGVLNIGNARQIMEEQETMARQNVNEFSGL